MIDSGPPLFELMSRAITARTGLALPPNRRTFIESGIARAMAKAGIADPTEYLYRLARTDLLLDALICELTVGETYFFRDNAHFELIRASMLPELHRRRGPAHSVWAWSAGCASAEEPYSLAMLFEEEGLANRSHILATDISSAALAIARRANYGVWSMRNCSEATIRRHFQREGARYVLAPTVRDRVDFDRLNLAFDHYPGLRRDWPAMDLILCRNVLIYLDPARIPDVARRLFHALANGGWLVTGPSDPLLAQYAPYDVMQTPAGLVYRRPDPHDRSAAERDNPREPASAAAPIMVRARTPEHAIPLGSLDRASEALHRNDGEAVMDAKRDLAADLALREPDFPTCADLGNLDEAEARAAAAAAEAPLSVERHLGHAIILMELGRWADAALAIRRVIYLDHTLAVAHLLLGTILCRLRQPRSAERAYRVGYELASSRPTDEIVPYSDGAPAASLARAAKEQMALLAAVAKGAA